MNENNDIKDKRLREQMGNVSRDGNPKKMNQKEMNFQKKHVTEMKKNL